MKNRPINDHHFTTPSSRWWNVVSIGLGSQSSWLNQGRSPRLSRLGKTWILRQGILWGICVALVACQSNQVDPAPSPEQADSSGAIEAEEGRLSLDNATLEQTDDNGKPLWKIHTRKAVYSFDRKSAQLEKLNGDIFQNGELVLQVEGQQGEILNDGVTLLLRENIIATDPRNGATIRAESVEWQPQKGILVVSDNLRGSHQDLVAQAKEGRYYTEQKRMELVGQIVANLTDPTLQLKTERLIWQIEQERLIGDRRLTIVRFDPEKKDVITDRLVGDKAEVLLNKDQVLMRQNIEFRSVDPPVQIATNVVRWDYKNEIIDSNQPTQVYHRDDDIRVTGNRMRVNLAKQVARADGNTQSTSGRQSSRLFADALLWRIPDQRVEALGNINYEQAGNPPFNLTGERAVGRLSDNSVVVSGNRSDRVLTEIFP